MNNAMLLMVYKKLRGLSEIPMPVKQRYHISKIFTYVENKLKPYFETEKTLVEHYAVRDNDGKIQMNEQGGIMMNRTKQCVEEFDELLVIEVELTDVPKISLDYLIDVGLELTELEMQAFDIFIE